MGERDDVDARREQAFVARVARLRLQARAWRARQVQPMKAQRDVARRALRGAEIGPAIRIGRQPMVDVNCGQDDRMPLGQRGGGVEQHDGIESAGQRDSEARARTDMPGESRGERRAHDSDGVVRRRFPNLR